jgi:signal transduction histidine kinase
VTLRLRLHHRIVLPFAAVAIIATAAVAWVAFNVTSNTLATHIRQDVISATGVVSRNGVALTPGILSAVRQVTGADAVTFGPGGLVATTLDRELHAALIDRVIAGAAHLALREGTPMVVELPGQPSIFVAYCRVEGQQGFIVALVHENTEVERVNRMLMRTILGAAGLSLLFMILVSQFVARRVTAPITRLAAFAQEVSTSKTRGRAEAGADEVGQLGAAFNDMLERLDHAQSAVVKAEKLGLAGLFAARVAHDVRNPLSSIKMQTQLLNAGLAPGSEAREMTEAMLQDIGQVEFVVKGLLDLARPAPTHRVLCQLNMVLSGVVRQVTPQCRHRHIAITSNLAADMPEMSLDPDRLAQAFLNIVVNAMEALREGGTLQVSSRLDANAGAVVVEVDDDGVGLASGSAGQVFDPFVTTKPGGVGLGLMNARAAIESHGGTVALVPRTPSGTRAIITLPVG